MINGRIVGQRAARSHHEACREDYSLACGIRRRSSQQMGEAAATAELPRYDMPRIGKGRLQTSQVLPLVLPQLTQTRST